MNRTSTKGNKSSIVKNTDTTKPTVFNNDAFDDYYCVFSFKRKPMSEAGINKLTELLIQWANKNGSDTEQESLRLDDFYDEIGISKDDFYRWSHKYPQFRQAHDYANRRLASRREIGAMKRRYDGNFVAKTLGHYCPVFKEETERFAQLKLASINESANLSIVMLPAENTPEVPERNKE